MADPIVPRDRGFRDDECFCTVSVENAFRFMVGKDGKVRFGEVFGFICKKNYGCVGTGVAFDRVDCAKVEVSNRSVEVKE
jgi:hypothetical protein